MSTVRTPLPFTPHSSRPDWIFALVCGGILATAMFIRLSPWAAFKGIGYDESLYIHYLRHLDKTGLWNYSDVVDAYIQYQKTLPGSILPPTRFLYIFFAYLWEHLLGIRPEASFYAVSRTFSVLSVLLSWLFAWRLLRNRWFALGVFALASCSPLQIHMAQHALVDGFFTFWAWLTLWALWESLSWPNRRVWPVTYGLGLAAMVLTKENAFFVFSACVVILILNRWVRFGQVSQSVLLATLLGPLAGMAVLVNLAGGLPTLVEAYKLSVSKNFTLPYAILTGDGPWFRYLLDLMTVSPIVLVLALATIFQLRAEDKSALFLLIFIGTSYIVMANLKYGMNLRYATMWDTPLRVLALWQIVTLCHRVGGSFGLSVANGAITVVLVGLCALDLWQYHRLAVDYPLYELVPQDLLQALKILKYS